ncbi:MAG: hypothetical protein QNL01_02710 [Akkermansiaceae bacterium]
MAKHSGTTGYSRGFIKLWRIGRSLNNPILSDDTSAVPLGLDDIASPNPVVDTTG